MPCRAALRAYSPEPDGRVVLTFKGEIAKGNAENQQAADTSLPTVKPRLRWQ
jgi:hypothetical protein